MLELSSRSKSQGVLGCGKAKAEAKASCPQETRGDLVIRVQSQPRDPKPVRTRAGQGEAIQQDGGGPIPVLVYPLG